MPTPARRSPARLACFALALALGPVFSGAATAKEAPGPAPADVQAAIDRGAAWLEGEYAEGFLNVSMHDVPELVLLTLVHAKADRTSKVFLAALEATLTAKLSHTYRVATMAMALSTIDALKYRARLAHCAQWLADTQCPKGEWGYPGGHPGTENPPHAVTLQGPVTDEQARAKGGTEAIVIERRSMTDPVLARQGDFSNTQFALLGLRACAHARITIPKETWERAMAYQRSFQQRDGSWGYVVGGEQDMAGYASLTCAGIAGVAICHHGMGKRNPKAHPAVKKGLAWLKKNWDPRRNVGIDQSSIVGPSSWQYYHLYAIERVGRILGLTKIAKRNWYAEGATWILARQARDGSWKDPEESAGRARNYLKTADGCFALLFLTLATPPLTGG